MENDKTQIGEYAFSCRAMNGELNLKICAESESYAYSAFHDIELSLEILEDKLSMFREGGDIFTINAIGPGEVARISPDTLDCLAQAQQAHEMSLGAVDVCMGEFFINRKNLHGGRIESPSRISLKVDTENFLVEKVSEGMIDLGAIGKGFAVDMMVKILKEVWEIKSAFISFAHSSIYAFGKRPNGTPWKITFGGAETEFSELDGAAVGASGTAMQGSHITDPRDPMRTPECPFRTWVICESAAFADALSTAFMLLTEAEVRQICAEHSIKGFIQKTPDSAIVKMF